MAKKKVAKKKAAKKKVAKKKVAKKKATKKKGAKKKATEKPEEKTMKLTRENKTKKSDEKKPMREIGLSLNWNRAIHINSRIDDALLKELTPIILRMKQESSEAITVGIDSTGGSISAVESLLGLLKSPDQDGKWTHVYTASTNRSYSAAASLLAFGDYSVAFPHSKILYHDVRYAGLEDVTPDKALQTARELERSNTALSLRLANHISRRLIWGYLDLIPQLKGVRSQYASFAKEYDEYFKEHLPKEKDRAIDIVGFALTLFSRLSSPLDSEIAIQALKLLASWLQIEKIEQRISGEKTKGDKPVDLVKGINDLIKEIRGMETPKDTSSKSPEPKERGLNQSSKNDIKLLIEVLARRFAIDKNLSISEDGLDVIMEDFTFIKDINSRQHVKAITRLMLDHEHIFFGRSIEQDIKNAKNSDEKRKILDPVYPQARMFWHYIVLLCRCLCRGEHFLKPGDAQLLGLVDEILGGGPVQSRREWRKANPE